MKPFFSIIIPTLNEELFIPKLLVNLKEQKKKNFEVIIIDANSKDKTKEAISKYKNKLNIKFFQTKKKNVSFQKNLGTKYAKGKYLIFLDADCKINKFFTKIFEREIEKKKGLLFFPYISPEEKTPQTKTIYQFLNFMIDISQRTNNPYSSVGCLCIEKNLFILIKGFNEKLYVSEDFEIARSANKWGVKGVHLPRVKFTFSFRRVRKEGKLKSLYKLIVGGSSHLLKADMRKKIYDYEMGGHLYKKKDLNITKAKFIEFDISKIKKYMKDLISDIES